MIVVPAIDLREGRCVRLVRGDPARETEYSRDPVAVARRFEAEGAPLLHLVDLDAAMGVGTNVASVRAVCESIAVPVQVGGGLRTVASIDRVLRWGAARAVLGTAAARDPEFVRRAVERFGDRIVVAVDVLNGRARIRGWLEEGPPLEELLAALTRVGPPRLLVTAVAVDGTLQGPDLDLYRRVLGLTDRPVLASGGIGSVRDLLALAEVGVEGAVVGTALYEGRVSLPEALRALAARPATGGGGLPAAEGPRRGREPRP